MAKPMALIILLAIALQLTFPLSKESMLGTAGKKFAARGQYPYSSGIPLFFITPRLTKPRTTTTILASCPRKHTRFRIQVLVKPQPPSPLSLSYTMPLLVVLGAIFGAAKTGSWRGREQANVTPTATAKILKGGCVIECAGQKY